MVHSRGYIGIALLLWATVFSVGGNCFADEIEASPKEPWGKFVFEENKKNDPWWIHMLLWLPNRVLDAVDMVRVDVGAGSSVGAVVRVTKQGQAGYRSIDPASVRIGLMGRRSPVVVERSSERGIGPGFVSSKERRVCPGEVGVGADAFLVGAYAGICFDEVIDFLAGFIFLDPLGDDIL